MAKLTPREQEVVKYLIVGLSQKQIAHKMGISPNTASTYIKRARKRTNSGSAIELAVKCAGAMVMAE